MGAHQRHLLFRELRAQTPVSGTGGAMRDELPRFHAVLKLRGRGGAPSANLFAKRFSQKSNAVENGVYSEPAFQTVLVEPV